MPITIPMIIPGKGLVFIMTIRQVVVVERKLYATKQMGSKKMLGFVPLPNQAEKVFETVVRDLAEGTEGKAGGG